jgi:hypothetical protein
LVFVILTFFKEGIGNNLTMPLGSWNLENGSWKLGLLGLVGQELVTLVTESLGVLNLENGSWKLGLGTCGTGTGNIGNKESL